MENDHLANARQYQVDITGYLVPLGHLEWSEGFLVALWSFGSVPRAVVEQSSTNFVHLVYGLVLKGMVT